MTNEELTLLDQFAGEALNGALSGNIKIPKVYDVLARHAYDQAEAMVAHRRKIMNNK